MLLAIKIISAIGIFAFPLWYYLFGLITGTIILALSLVGFLIGRQGD